MKLQFSFMPISKHLQLPLRLDKAVICRPKRFWDKMIREIKFDENETSENKDI